jgi:SulP family sulfate permease
MAALVAVMIMVSIGTFSWASVKNLRNYPWTSNIVMIVTVIVVVLTHDLAKGVFVGVLMSALFFAKKVSRLLTIKSEIVSEKVGDNHRIYHVYGQVYFASAEYFSNAFDFKEVIEKVTIDLTQTHFWDLSAVGALDKVVLKFRREGTEVILLGLNEASATIVEQYGEHQDPDAVELMPKH